MIEFDEYKVKLNNIRPRLDALADSLGIEAAKEEIDRLHAQIDSEGFWDNQEISQKVMKQSRTLEAKVARYEKMCSQWDDLYTLCEMALEDNDDSMLPELTDGYAQLEQEMEKDRVPAKVIDMTALGLVEITRKKVRKPLYELLGKGKGGTYESLENLDSEER